MGWLTIGIGDASRAVFVDGCGSGSSVQSWTHTLCDTGDAAWRLMEAVVPSDSDLFWRYTSNFLVAARHQLCPGRCVPALPQQRLSTSPFP